MTAKKQRVTVRYEDNEAIINFNNSNEKTISFSQFSLPLYPFDNAFTKEEFKEHVLWEFEEDNLTAEEFDEAFVDIEKHLTFTEE